MPPVNEHVAHSNKRIGVKGTEIHKWIDALFGTYHTHHRRYRHDFASCMKEIVIVRPDLIEKFGIAVTEKVVKDHIDFDNNGPFDIDLLKYFMRTSIAKRSFFVYQH